MTDKNPTVSVIIPTYNRAHFLERAIKSVLNQTYTNLEVIVVDDGSTDKTSNLIARLTHMDSRIIYLKHVTNRGSQAARNTGIRAAQGDYIAFLDSDDEWLPSKLAKQMALFAASGSNLGVVYSGFLWEYHDGTTPEVRVPRYRGYIYKEALREWISDTNTLLIRKNLLYKAGLWNENIRANQEWDLCIRLARFAEFDFITEPLAIHYRHGGPSISKSIVDKANGCLDVIIAHLPEIIIELGRPALSIHLFYVGKCFFTNKDIKLSLICFRTAFRVWPFIVKYYSNWILYSLIPSAYFKVIAAFNIKNCKA